MTRTSLVLICLVVGGTALAAPKQQEPPRNNAQIRGSCYRELGYDPTQLSRTKVPPAIMAQVNECAARKGGR